MRLNKTMLLTIDVEDWFQVENFKNWISFETWPEYELRVEKNTYQILDLLDSFSVKTRFSDNDVITSPKATFFIMAWLADQIPQVVREIQSRGHEIASHGYNHVLCTKMNQKNLETDLTESKKRLEDITGKEVYGFRAPSFAIDNYILETVRKCGYFYDSSYNTFGFHDRYGKLDLTPYKKYGISHKISNDFFELPINNFKSGKFVMPVGGGGYFRLIPFPFFKLFVKLIFRREDAYIFYMHPWEIDFRQPKCRDAGIFYKFRHYTNIARTKLKLKALIHSFNDCHFMTCHNYLEQIL